MNTICECTRAKREGKGPSLKYLAQKAGVYDSHIIYIEKGQRKPVRLKGSTEGKR